MIYIYIYINFRIREGMVSHMVGFSENHTVPNFNSVGGGT